MKTLNIYKKTTLALMALTMGLSLVGCAEDSELIYQGAQQLSVKPQILDSKVSRATASDAKLNEEKLIKFNIKMFGEYDECKVDKTFTTDLQSGKEEVIAQNNWKVEKDLQEGNTYSVKSVANATGSGNVQIDLDIWKPYDDTGNSNKKFLMSSIQDYEVTKEPTQTIKVNLARAAAKIVLTVHVDVKGYTAGQVKWQLMNYNAKTTIFGNNIESELKDGEMVEAQGGSGKYTVTTYSYATQWTDDDTKAPAIYLQVPLTADGNTEMNYYKIPVRDPKDTGEDAKKLNRNTIYTIDAKINNKGGSSEIGYVTTGKVVYDVLPWSNGGTTDIDANTSYLMVYPQSLIMKNIATDNTSISYKSSNELEISIDEVYYYNKNGVKTAIKKGYTEKDDNGKDVQLYPKVTLSTDENGKYQGKINIESAVPINLTAKYIVFSVKTKDGKDSKQVIVKQYPLKYVQNIAGWYSTKDLDNWIDWERDQTKHDAVGSDRWGYYGKTSGDSWFDAKVYGTFKDPDSYYGKTVTGIWDYEDQGRGKTDWQANVTSYTTSQANNHMYVIQITKSDGTYKIARPRFNNLKSDDHTVSPAFMLASQLGVVKPFNTFEDAAKHCDAYVEVSMNKKRYDDWRLPTQEEINSIVEFQNDKKAANTMDRVLKGYYYWTANGGKSNKVPGSNIDNSPGAVRCIRDLSPTEVQELENNLK
ncbi:MAG: hypothetical protein PUB50_10795 [Prevotella copri]|nr:hypothetical protein [Segatella copri]